MRKIRLVLFALSLPVYLAAQCSTSQVLQGSYGKEQGASGMANYLISMPAANCFNGDIILFAHGFVAPGSPTGAWQSQLTLPDGTTLPALVNSLGFGFAASGFSKETGLDILQGIQDTKALTNVIAGLGIHVNEYFVTGASEGGVVAAKSVENKLGYGGGLAVCGPIGSFQDEINYIGNARVLFDYFFPGVLPGTAIDIPSDLIANWTMQYEPAVVKAVSSNPLATLQLLATAQIPIGLSLSNAPSSIVQVLTYNVFATADAQATLGGNPFDNERVVYHGSFNDARLNAAVTRFAATPSAITSVHEYETTGRLPDPLVTLHTIFDPIVPFSQETLYLAKALRSLPELVQIPVAAYGHCNVTGEQAGAALAVMLQKAGL